MRINNQSANLYRHGRTLAAHTPCMSSIRFASQWLCVALFALLIFTMSGAFANASSTPLPTLADADPTVVYGPEVTYRITRNGKRIGTHTVTFDKSGDTLDVRLESKITVTILKVPVYRFNYVAEERYSKGKLASISASTNENGKVKKVSLDNSTLGNQSNLLQANGKTRATALLHHGSNHWQPAALEEPYLFNTLTGKPSKVNLKVMGKSELTLSGEKVAARHYNYSGSIRADVWYDDKGRWLQLSFTGDDGSLIKYQIDGYAAISHI